jgi:hypothetical protein
MKSAPNVSAKSSASLPRHLVAMLAYVNGTSRKTKCVDATFGGAEVHLDRLAAAARMQ